MHPLTRPRHLAFTMAVFLLAGGSIGGTMGVVGAQASDVEGTFTFAAPMAGDEARYTVTGGMPSRTGAYNLTWLPDEQLILDDGSKGWYNSVRVVDRPADPQGRATDFVYHLIPGTHDSVAFSHARQETTTEDGRSVTVLWDSRVLQDRVGAVACGLIAPWQGQTVDLSKQTYPGTYCWMADNAMDHIGHYEISAYIEESDTIIIKALRGGLAMTFWYQADIPYPVRVVEEDGDDDAVWTLDAFARGTEEVRRRPSVDAALAVQPLRMAPVPAWGLDTRGVDLPLHPETAWNAALNDPSYNTLRDYLASHPSAYVVSVMAGHFEDLDRSQEWHYWNFDVTDGDEYVSVHARLIQADGGLLPALPGQSGGAWTFSDRGVEDAEGWGHPRPDAVPRTLPTLASMLAQWEQHRGPDYQDRPGNYGRLELRCDETCDESYVHVEAGHAAYIRDHAGPAYVVDDYSDHYESSVLAWTADAEDGLRLSGYHEQTQDWYDEGNPPAHVQTIAPQGVSLSAVGAWRMLTGTEVAVAGAGAALVGLLYFFYPLLKTGLVGLFSRIQTSELLDNPQRRRLMGLVEAQPGIHHQELVRALDIGKGAVDHHLRKLHEGGLLTVHKATGYTCYFPKKTDRRVLAAAPVLKSAAAQRIVEHVRKQPGALAVDVRNAVGISPSTMHYHMKRLSDAGVLDVVKEGNGQRLLLVTA